MATREANHIHHRPSTTATWATSNVCLLEGHEVSIIEQPGDLAALYCFAIFGKVPEGVGTD